MNELQVLFVQIVAFWAVAVGLTLIAFGPDRAKTVAWWPLCATVRLLRRAIGGLLIALGNAVRGKK